MPDPGTHARKGETVVVTVSMGPASLPVPMVTGYSLADAIARAQAAGLTLAVVYEPS